MPTIKSYDRGSFMQKEIMTPQGKMVKLGMDVTKMVDFHRADTEHALTMVKQV